MMREAMSAVTKPREYFIQGVTLDGKTFRPSDWAERLAGAMSSFRPAGSARGIAAHIGYSPLCVPQVMGNTKCVIVSEALREVEPMAWDFVMAFARDNQLKVVEACLVPEPDARSAPAASAAPVAAAAPASTAPSTARPAEPVAAAQRQVTSV
jgi:hypothetical protein